MTETESNDPARRSDSWLALKSCLDRLSHGPWKFIRLRKGSLSEDAIDGDDVDLLGSRGSVDALLLAAQSWVRAGECHLRVKSGNGAKVGLHLISSDGRHRLDFDLWIDLRQIDDRKRGLTYDGCRSAVINPADSIQQLPIEVEASIFIHHLVSKRKKISAPKQLARLTAYAEECRKNGGEMLAGALESTAAAAKVSDETAQLTLGILEKSVRVSQPGAIRHTMRRLTGAISSAWFTAPWKFPMLVIMGCDGCGKTTLAKQLSKRRSDIHSVYTGKHLYRKWIIYKLLVIFVRPLLFQGREKFDDTFAPLAYLLASLRLRLKLLIKRKGTVLIDRSLMDFLLVARKTDTPKFCASTWLSSAFGVRLPHVHFIVPFERLQERKLEMTRAGHEIYDNEMFRHFTGRAPTDYTLFDNRGSLEDSADALERVFEWLNQSC
ncbi:MAG: hypothetical protein V4584_08205 [Verrucomicrobiota bacterium]